MPSLHSQIRLLHMVHLDQLASLSLQDDPAVFQNVSTLGELQRKMHILLHKQDRQALQVDLFDRRKEILDELGRQS